MEKITINTTVSTAELALILGLTGRRIRQMAEDGELERVSPGRFSLCSAVQQYMKLHGADPATAEDLKIERSKRKSEAILKESKATIARLEAEELRGNIHRSEDVAAMTEDLVYTIRGALISLPGRLAVDVAVAKTPAEAAEIIRQEVYSIMAELSKYRYDPAKYRERIRERRNWELSNGCGDMAE